MKFSVIIPAHNEESVISKALESIKQQSFTDYELIVVCDACTDRTKEIAEKFLYYLDRKYNPTPQPVKEFIDIKLWGDL